MTTIIALSILSIALFKGYKFLNQVSDHFTEDTQLSDEINKKVINDAKKMDQILSDLQVKVLLSEKVADWKRIYLSLPSEGSKMREFIFEDVTGRIEFKCRYSVRLNKYYVQIKGDGQILSKSEIYPRTLEIVEAKLIHIEKVLKEKFIVFKEYNEKNKISQMSEEELLKYKAEQVEKERILSLKQKKYRKEISEEEHLELQDYERREAQIIWEKRKEQFQKVEAKKKKVLEERAIQLQKINESEISTNPGDYEIDSEDFKRNSEKEIYYRRKNKLFLLKLYENKCAKCGDFENGVDLDHFAIPKSKGGSFMMKTRHGVFINNAIPLCERCNRSKSNKDYRSFFSVPELAYILDKNKEMNNRINDLK